MTYADYIRSLPCSACADDTTVQQHHLIDIEGIEKGIALKLPEVFSIPLCAKHHRELHEDLQFWADVYGSQLGHLLKTILLASRDGWEMTNGD